MNSKEYAEQQVAPNSKLMWQLRGYIVGTVLFAATLAVAGWHHLALALAAAGLGFFFCLSCTALAYGRVVTFATYAAVVETLPDPKELLSTAIAQALQEMDDEPGQQ